MGRQALTPREAMMQMHNSHKPCDIFLSKRHGSLALSTRSRMINESSAISAHDAFHTTRWTRVCLAKAESEEGRRALADLCDAYYEPVVAFLRHELRDPDAAREMGHAFFA